MDKLKSFICDSKTFGGFAFDGCYTMSRDVFFKLMNVYLQTGENLLDNYSDYIYLKWEEVSTHGSYYNIGECDRVGESLSNLRRHKIVNPEDLADQRDKLKEFRRICIHWEERKRSKPRRDACTHTGKKAVRKAVFLKYGRKCLACGSTKNICIDHVIPVDKGGENDILNYQPLCKSCNSRKGTNTTDYRKGKKWQE